MKYNVFIVCETLRHAKYYADEFMKRYIHRIIQVKRQGLEYTIKYEDENEVRINFITTLNFNQMCCGYRNLRCMTGEVSEHVNFDRLTDILEIPVYR